MSRGPAVSTLENMMTVFDVAGAGGHRYRGTSDGGSRSVVDGSQLLAQAIVASAKSFPLQSVLKSLSVFLFAV
jgi:acyl-CoA thioesterase